MQEIFVPWAVWYGKAPFKMEFPDHWDVAVHQMRGGPDIGDAGIRHALQEAIGARRCASLPAAGLRRPS